MTTSPDRQTFRTLVAEVAARAKARLPEAVNGRVESAAKLVLLHDVSPQADGTIVVGSSTDPLKTYCLVGDTCECQDWQHGKAPGGWCQHRIAAGIHKRVGEVLAAQEAQEGTEAAQTTVDTSRLADAPTSLPEAPVSITLKGMLAGQDVMVTLRGADFASVKAHVEAAAQWLDRPTPVTAPASTQGEGYCAVHQVQMRWNAGKPGDKGWWSHKTAEGWCKGKGSRS
jgi:hypothetical protein